MKKITRKFIGSMVNNDVIKKTIKALLGNTKLYRKLQYGYYEENLQKNQGITPVVIYRDAEMEDVLKKMSMNQLRIFLDLVNNESDLVEEYIDESCD